MPSLAFAGLRVGFFVRLELGFAATFTRADRDRFERFELRLPSGGLGFFFV